MPASQATEHCGIRAAFHEHDVHFWKDSPLYMTSRRVLLSFYSVKNLRCQVQNTMHERH